MNRDRQGAGCALKTRLLTRAVHRGFIISHMNYFITFRTYGTWLHGDARGSVDREHNQYGEPLREPSVPLEQAMRRAMKNDPCILNEAQRQCVEQAIRGVAGYRGWVVHALNVRSNHVHVVVTVDDVVQPEKVMNDFKVWATRRLREQQLVPNDAKIWERHGSTRHLRREQEFYNACHYVLHCQDEPHEDNE